MQEGHAVNESKPKPHSHWTEDRVDRLLLRLFGDQPQPADHPVSSRHSTWSHWTLVATCAGLLAVITPVLWTPRPTDRVAHREPTSENVADDSMVLAEASADSTEESLSPETADEISNEEASEPEPADEPSETTST
jgi:hypothetical protein